VTEEPVASVGEEEVEAAAVSAEAAEEGDEDYDDEDKYVIVRSFV
jgi:hypothetical protein